ncbi:MAG: integration host factor, actinobacterial type [Brooklawnia sp.]|uniref:integration host factor, actinobacterial type n=1 Tax=Brooklawnia sp. TaxID=2699740 RepID=UPI003C776D22
MAIPTLSPEQLQAARAAATEARRVRASLKNAVREGSKTLPEALDACADSDVLAHIRVVDLLKAVPRIGEKRASEMMAKYDIAANRRVRGLGRHQIAGLKQEFS